MKHINNVKEALGEMYHNKVYLIITLVVTFLIFSFNAVINNYRILISDFSFKLFFSLIGGTINSMRATSLILLITMSILAGVVLSMSIYLLRRQIKANVSASFSSILVSLVAPACPSCAIGLLSVLGFGSFLAVLPFKGLELGVLGIALLITSTIYLSGKIVTKTCDIETKGGKENE